VEELDLTQNSNGLYDRVHPAVKRAFASVYGIDLVICYPIPDDAAARLRVVQDSCNRWFWKSVKNDFQNYQINKV